MDNKLTFEQKIEILDRASFIAGCQGNIAAPREIADSDKTDKVISIYKKLEELLNP